VEFVEIFKLAVVREESHANSHMISKSTRSGRSQKTMSQGNDKEMKLGKEKVFPTPPHHPPPTSPASTLTKLEVIMTIIMILRNNIKYRLLTN